MPLPVSHARAPHTLVVAACSPSLPAPRRPFFSQQTFIKVVNYQHLMPTRYTLEVSTARHDTARRSAAQHRVACVQRALLLSVAPT